MWLFVISECNFEISAIRPGVGCEGGQGDNEEEWNRHLQYLSLTTPSSPRPNFPPLNDESVWLCFIWNNGKIIGGREIVTCVGGGAQYLVTITKTYLMKPHPTPKTANHDPRRCACACCWHVHFGDYVLHTCIMLALIGKSWLK